MGVDPEWRLAESRERQRALYGAPIAEKVHRIVRALGLTQAQLAATVGVSPAMMSQLVSGKRVKIGDPAVLARFRLVDERCAAGPVPRAEVPALLAEVRRTGPTWAGPPPRSPEPVAVEPAETRPPPARDPSARRAADATEALRAVAGPARLVAAAAALGPGFPEIAALLRRAAAG